jgi:hypothetical protein
MAEVLGPTAVFYTALMTYSLSVPARDIIKTSKSYREISQFTARVTFLLFNFCV